MATHSIPIQGRGQIIGGPTTSLAVASICASVVACVGLSLSAALHIFGGLPELPILAEASVSSHLWLAAWNILFPCSLLGITLLTYRSWRKRDLAGNL
ncbi:MAG TPA: hypothetical protein VFU86_20015 [Terriglobales bacterium]|nr:hypothetical protein [Terriglobales bacterium]